MTPPCHNQGVVTHYLAKMSSLTRGMVVGQGDCPYRQRSLQSPCPMNTKIGLQPVCLSTNYLWYQTRGRPAKTWHQPGGGVLRHVPVFGHRGYRAFLCRPRKKKSAKMPILSRFRDFGLVLGHAKWHTSWWWLVSPAPQRSFVAQGRQPLRRDLSTYPLPPPLKPPTGSPEALARYCPMVPVFFCSK